MKTDRQKDIENNITGNLELILKTTSDKLDEHLKVAQRRYEEYLKFIDEYNKEVSPTLDRINILHGSRERREFKHEII